MTDVGRSFALGSALGFTVGFALGLLLGVVLYLTLPRQSAQLTIRTGFCQAGDTAHFRTMGRVNDSVIGAHLDDILIGCIPP